MKTHISEANLNSEIATISGNFLQIFFIPQNLNSGINCNNDKVGKMEVVVEMDDKGRILIPLGFRRGLPSKRLIMRRIGERLELIPLPSLESLKGKYRLEGEIEDIEELQEQRLLERG